MRINFYLLPVFAWLLAACSNLGGAVGSVAQAYWNSRNPPSYAQIPLKPQLTYLEVLGVGNSALMVLANIDQSSTTINRPVETWVSGSGEVLRTQSGFVVGSAGVPYLPEVSQTRWGGAEGTSSQPVRLELNMPGKGLSQLPMVWQSVSVPARLLAKPGPLLQRAQQVQGLKLSAWLAQAEGAAPRIQNYAQVFQLVGTHPTTGSLVYGQYCVGGLATGQCIEYLLRTAAQNL
jgi:hypothetical protein